MNILIISATSFEIAPLLAFLEKEAEKVSFFQYRYRKVNVYPLVTGVGALNTSFAIARFPDIKTVGMAINAGVAGAYDRNLTLGEVVEVMSDRFADLGVEEKDGSFTDVFDLQLADPNMFPYSDGWIKNETDNTLDLKKVPGLTVNKVHGTTQSIERILAKYKADVETMEGAGFLYACRVMDVKCIQLRAISNYVEPRNKDNWEIELAIEKLNKTLIDYLNHLSNPNLQ